MEFGKIHRSLWEGSMTGRADALLVWIYLCVHADVEGFIDEKQERIAALNGLTVERVRAAIEYLEAPDPHSRTPDLEGRRLERIHEHRDWGWRIVNRTKYKDLTSAEDRRQQNRDAQTRRRLRVAAASAGVSNPALALLTGAEESAPSAHRDLDSERDTPKPYGLGAPVLSFPTNRKGETWPLTAEQFKRWVELFPAVNVDQECRKALAWCEAHRPRRKTLKGMEAFLAGWLGRVQDRGGAGQNARARVDGESAGSVRQLGGTDG